MLKSSRVYKKVLREVARCEGQLGDDELIDLLAELIRDLSVRRNIAVGRRAKKKKATALRPGSGQAPAQSNAEAEG